MKRVWRVDSEWETDLFTVIPNPIHNLLAAILARAVIDLYSPNKQIAREARAWFKRKKPVPNSFSYEEVIEHLGFTPSQVKLITNKIEELCNGKCMSEGEAGGEEHSELVKRARMLVGPQVRSALWRPCGFRHRVA